MPTEEEIKKQKEEKKKALKEELEETQKAMGPFAIFQSLPLDFILGEPLKATVKAQEVVADTSLNFIQNLLHPDGTPYSAKFKFNREAGNDSTSVEIDAPLLSMVPIPNLKVDSLSVNFRFEIRHTETKKFDLEAAVETAVETGALLSPWAKGSITGSVSSKSGSESELNRSGVLEINMQASEAPMPEGLARILDLMAKSIPPVATPE